VLDEEDGVMDELSVFLGESKLVTISTKTTQSQLFRNFSMVFEPNLFVESVKKFFLNVEKN
jgi:hypothetical protein